MESEKKYIEMLVDVVAKTLVEAFENITISDVNMYQLGYNKGVDDVLEILKKHEVPFDADANSDILHLKDGGENA